MCLIFFQSLSRVTGLLPTGRLLHKSPSKILARFDYNHNLRFTPLQSGMNLSIDSNADITPLCPIPSSSKRLFLVRHGEVINPGGSRPVYYGAMDVSLSPLGESEAKAAAVFLKQFKLQHVASSPLSRAIFGAKQIISEQQLPDEENTDPTIFPGFMELDRGLWCGKTKAEIGSNIMARFDACDESVTPEGGESYPTLKNRVLLARDELLQVTDKGKASAIVSHLQVTRCLLSDALGIPVEKMTELKVATASVTCIDYDFTTGGKTVHFHSFKPNFGLEQSNDYVN